MMAGSKQSAGIERKVRDFLVGHRLPASRAPLVVAVSGGPDSVCLLHVLRSLRGELGFTLHAAHMDHGLRGEESMGDAQYVLDLCHKLGVPVTIEQRDVEAYRREHRLTLEEAAREVRYTFFAEVAAELGSRHVAVGHTLDDHVETVLLHIIRGTGTRGLAGLQAVRQAQIANRPVTIIRPLLTCTRAETAAYCGRHHLHPRTDSSNLSTEPLRNRVRLLLLPALKTYNPAIVEALARTARIAADDSAYLEAATTRQWRRVARAEDKATVLDRERLARLAPALQRSVLRRAVEERAGTLKDIEARHIEEMMALLQKPAGRAIHLPYGLTFAAGYDSFRLGRQAEADPPYPPLDGEHDITVPGVTALPGWEIQASVHTRGATPAEAGLAVNLDYDTAGTRLTVRPHRPGDRFQPLGMEAEKKVARFLLDAHMPRNWRDCIPLVCAGEKVLWVVGQRIDEHAKMTAQTTRVLRLQFVRR